MANEEEILKELRKMSKILIMSNGANLERELGKYATNEDRKKIWVLIDGNRQADDIVKATGLTKTPVYNFLKILEDSDLIERQRGKPPKRLLDYVPAEWTNLVQTDIKQLEKVEQPQSASVQPETLEGNQNG
ncbi:MAG: helix-turn-helix domain-containing protein [Nitrosotalea sp.]